MDEDKPAMLRMKCDFRPGQTDLEKAQAGLDVYRAFTELCHALGDDVAPGKLSWAFRGMTFDGDDVGAQPIYDALMAAYERGRADGSKQPQLPPRPSGG